MDTRDPLDAEIATMHERFVRVMARRLPAFPPASKERYFALLASLVGKLEADDKPLREILQEMMAEATSAVLQELHR